MATLELKVVTEPKAAQIDGLFVGADVFELMTKALYTEPLAIYREYVQNSTDAIEAAVDQEKLPSRSAGRIEISINPSERAISIRDNGSGIEASEFEERLTSLGASKKRGKGFRGFRGIGRLSALAFAQQLTFRSRGKSSEHVREITWDGRRLKELLSQPETNFSIEDLVTKIATTRTLESHEFPDHFFEVEIRGVVRLGNDDLLNEGLIKSYLEQVAPVAIGESFEFKPQLDDFLAKWGANKEYKIYLNGSEDHLVRPLRNDIHVGKGIYDRVLGVELFEIPGDSGIDAVGWMLTHSYLGSVPRAEPVGGLRARVGNMQIGDRDLFADLFPQPRFNSWTVGEVHILNKSLQPNSRRDTFEIDVHSQNLASHLVVLGRQIASECRKQSNLRNAVKRCEQLLKSINTTLESFSVGIFPLEQATALIMRDLQYYEVSLSRLEGKLQSKYQEQLSKTKTRVAGVLADDNQTSLIDALPKAKRSIMKRVAEVLSLESPSPEFASRVISKILDS